MKAGPQTIIVTFVKKSAAYVDDLFQRFDATTADLQTGVQFGYTTVPHLSGVEILGRTTSPVPATRRAGPRIFVCRPASAKAPARQAPPPQATDEKRRPAPGRSCRRWHGAPSAVR